MKTLASLAAIAALTLTGASAHASRILEIDINDAQITRTEGTFDDNFTGSVFFDKDFDTRIVDVARGTLDETFEVELGSDLDNLSGQIDLVSGAVTGGSLTLALENGDSFSADLGSAGQIHSNVGKIVSDFTIDSLLKDGTFNDANSDGKFGDLDIAEFLAFNGSLRGAGFVLDYSGALSDEEGDLEVGIVAIPLPAPAALGGVLLGGLGLARLIRRRKI